MDLAKVGDRVRFIDDELFEENGVGYIKEIFPDDTVAIRFRYGHCCGAFLHELTLLKAVDPERKKNE